MESGKGTSCNTQEATVDDAVLRSAADASTVDVGVVEAVVVAVNVNSTQPVLVAVGGASADRHKGAGAWREIAAVHLARPGNLAIDSSQKNGRYGGRGRYISAIVYRAMLYLAA